MANQLRRLVVYPEMPRAEMEEICMFYDGDFSKDVMRERQQWFGRARKEEIAISVDGLRRDLRSNRPLRDVLPNLHAALVNYIVLPASAELDRDCRSMSAIISDLAIGGIL